MSDGDNATTTPNDEQQKDNAINNAIKISRRDFLKLIGSAGAIMAFSSFINIGKFFETFAQNNSTSSGTTSSAADTIIINGRIATMGKSATTTTNNKLEHSAVAIKDGMFIAVGTDNDILRYKNNNTKVIDVGGRIVIPGLNDSHIHIIRGGLNYNMELRWDGITSLKEAIQRLSEQALRTPQPQWVRVVGGWSEFQFVERRMPSINEIEQAAKDNPVFILHLYQSAILNKAAVNSVGYNKDIPNLPGSEIQRDINGNPTGLITAKPAATILYQTLSKGPKLSYDDQINSTRQFMYELNRFGITSAIDAGGGFQNYPDDYKVISDLAKEDILTVRIAYNLFPQRPNKELEDFTNWIKMVKPGEGNHFYRMNGAGENLVFSAADYENMHEPRPELAQKMESELKQVVKLLVQNRWPFRIHASYDESITRFLNVFEEVNNEIPFDGLKWFFDHAETISEQNLKRVKALGGGIAIQDRLAFQGEYFIERYGQEISEHSPPINKIIEMGIPLGAGTDATRVSTYNPWISLYWIVTGKSVGGTILRSKNNCLDRMEALRLYTLGSAWFSGEEDKKGSIEVGKLADIVVLSKDYFSIPEEEIKYIESVLTIVGGKIVYGKEEFKDIAPSPIPISPSWSPVAVFGGYSNVIPNQKYNVTTTYPSLTSAISPLSLNSNTFTTTKMSQQSHITISTPSFNNFYKYSSSSIGNIDHKQIKSELQLNNKDRKLLSCCDEHFSF